jgi:Mg2+/Co2+ transporter CorC
MLIHMPDSSDSPSARPTLLERLSAFLSHEPEDRDELLALLRAACERALIDADALAIIEGTLQMTDMQVADVMVPRAQMGVVHVDDSMEKIVAFAVKTAHSRFPVIGGDKDDVVGILLAKDLLRYFAGHESSLSEMLRPAVFIPESKRLDVLLREFRVSHNHMAIVVDEYGGVAGLVTIEDVLEQIVGEIEDEYDQDDSGANIELTPSGNYRVKAITEIGDFNTAFGSAFSDDGGVDTIGGLLIQYLGRLPRYGETVILGEMRFRVFRADSRRIHTLLVERCPGETGGSPRS